VAQGRCRTLGIGEGAGCFCLKRLGEAGRCGPVAAGEAGDL
jgi:hypothetical protein